MTIVSSYMFNLFVLCTSNVSSIDLHNSEIPNTLVTSLGSSPKFEWQYMYLAIIFSISIIIAFIGGIKSYIDGDIDNFDSFSKYLFIATIISSLTGVGNSVTSFIIGSQNTNQLQFGLSILLGSAIGFASVLREDQQREQLLFDNLLRAVIFLNILCHLFYSTIGLTMSYFLNKDHPRSDLLKDLYLANEANNQNMEYIRKELSYLQSEIDVNSANILSLQNQLNLFQQQTNDKINVINQTIKAMQETMTHLVTLQDIKNALLNTPNDFAGAFNSAIASYILRKDYEICNPILALIYSALPGDDNTNRNLQSDLFTGFFYNKDTTIPFTSCPVFIGPCYDNIYVDSVQSYIPSVNLYNNMLAVSNLISIDESYIPDNTTNSTNPTINTTTSPSVNSSNSIIYKNNSKNIIAMSTILPVKIAVNNFTAQFSPVDLSITLLPSIINTNYLNNAFGNVLTNKYVINPNLRSLLEKINYLVFPTKISFTNKYQIIVYRDLVGSTVFETIYIFHTDFICIISGSGYIIITTSGVYAKNPNSIHHTKVNTHEYTIGPEIKKNVKLNNIICSTYHLEDNAIVEPQSLTINVDPNTNNSIVGNNIKLSASNTQSICLLDNDFYIDNSRPSTVLVERIIQENQVILSSVNQAIASFNLIKIYFNKQNGLLDTIKIHDGNVTETEQDYFIYEVH